MLDWEKRVKIRIDRKNRPFSGNSAAVIIPKTAFEVRVYPVKLEFFNREKFSEFFSAEIFFNLKGAPVNFKIFLDLETSCIEVFANFEDEIIRYKIFGEGDRVVIRLEKAEAGNVQVCLRTNGKMEISSLKLKKNFYLPLRTKFLLEESLEKLSLGVRKNQDMELISRRNDLREVFPFWFVAGQKVPVLQMENRGIASLFDEIDVLVKKKEKQKLYNLFLNVFKAGFSGIFAPRLLDIGFQGVYDFENPFDSERTAVEASSLVLLRKGSEFIRSLFIRQNNNNLEVLPFLLSQFYCGKMTGIKLGNLGVLDIEWSKEILKKMILVTKKDEEINFLFQAKIKTFRMKKNIYDRGVICRSGYPVEVQKGSVYYFDRFEK